MRHSFNSWAKRDARNTGPLHSWSRDYGCVPTVLKMTGLSAGPVTVEGKNVRHDGSEEDNAAMRGGVLAGFELPENARGGPCNGGPFDTSRDASGARRATSRVNSTRHSDCFRPAWLPVSTDKTTAEGSDRCGEQGGSRDRSSPLQPRYSPQKRGASQLRAPTLNEGEAGVASESLARGRSQPSKSVTADGRYDRSPGRLFACAVVTSFVVMPERRYAVADQWAHVDPQVSLLTEAESTAIPKVGCQRRSTPNQAHHRHSR
jgi:hypothetical protein